MFVCSVYRAHVVTKTTATNSNLLSQTTSSVVCFYMVLPFFRTFIRSFFFFLCLVHFFSFFLALTYSPCLCLAETQIVNGCECVSKDKFYFSFARVPLFDPVGEVAFLQLIVFLSLGIFFLRLNMWADTFYILKSARVAFQKWLMRTYIILLIA